MRATIQNYLEAAKARREEDGEKGFSLIELIVVVAILGVLVAIAIPVFANIQSTAETNAAKAAAANGATSVAAAVANNKTAATDITADVLDKMSKDGFFLSLTKPASGAVSLDNYCVSVAKTSGGAAVATAGPGC